MFPVRKTLKSITLKIVAPGSKENQSCKKFPESTSGVCLSIFINAPKNLTHHQISYLYWQNCHQQAANGKFEIANLPAGNPERHKW